MKENFNLQLLRNYFIKNFIIEINKEKVAIVRIINNN